MNDKREQEDKEREKLKAKEKEFLALELAARLGSAFRSEPSTTAISATLVASGSQPLQQYNVPLDVITRVSQQQAQQVVEKNMIPLIDLTAKTTIQEHIKQERARESSLGEKAKKGGNEIFWIIVGILMTLGFTLLLNVLGIHV